MSDPKELKYKNWHIDYEKQIKYYESQQAALIALDLIISSYESGIWSGDSHLYLWHQEGETVDRDLLDRHYSANVLITTSYEQMFRIELFVKNKEDWIFKHGSDLLQQSLRAGYDCNEGYLTERLARDYPGFTAKEWGKYKKVDTPNEICLYACSGYKHSYCSIDKENYYITIDNYLGKYQLVKLIDPNLEIIRVLPQTEVMASIQESIASIQQSISAMIEATDRKEWIIDRGSDLLQQSLIAGYDCNDRYMQERIAHDYPGFEIATRNYPKVDSPDESCLYACLGYEGSYCSSNNKNYYITIDNFLGKYQLVKLIDASREVAEGSSSVQTATNTFGIQIRKYQASILNSSRNTRLLLANLTYALIVFFCLYITRLIFPS
jgi:hypothetical protein